MGIKELIKNLDYIVKTNSEIYAEGGSFIKHPWTLHNKASLKKIELFEKKGYIVPDSFKEFLLYSDGIECITSEQQIYSIDTMLQQAEINQDTLVSGIYEFAYFLGDRIFIDSSRIHTKNYIFFEGSVIGHGILMECDFPTFLERLILCNFCSYWRWTPVSSQAVFYLQD